MIFQFLHFGSGQIDYEATSCDEWNSIKIQEYKIVLGCLLYIQKFI
jgi:hypothetical protein